MAEPQSQIVAEAKAQVTALVTGIRESVTNAVSEAATKITEGFAEHVNKELEEMTSKFKETHPAITAAVTDVVGYADAINTAATAVKNTVGQVKDAATAMKELPGAIKDCPTRLTESAPEVAARGRGLKQMVTDAPGRIREFRTSRKGHLNNW